MVGGQRHVLASFALVKRRDTHFVGGWVGPMAGLDTCIRPLTVQPVATLSFVKSKCEVSPREGREGLGREWRYSSILSLTSALDGGV